MAKIHNNFLFLVFLTWSFVHLLNILNVVMLARKVNSGGGAPTVICNPPDFIIITTASLEYVDPSHYNPFEYIGGLSFLHIIFKLNHRIFVVWSSANLFYQILSYETSDNSIKNNLAIDYKKEIAIPLLKLLYFIAWVIELSIDINNIYTVSRFEYPVTVKVKVIMPPFKSNLLKVIEDTVVLLVLCYTLK